MACHSISNKKAATSESFTGTIIKKDGNSLQVVDQDGDVFDVDSDQVIVLGSCPIKVTDEQMVAIATDFIKHADADDLCELIEKMFGVTCSFNDDDESFEVVPTDDYCGAFDEIHLQTMSLNTR